MKRAWFGTALLAGSWLLGLDYFSPAQPVAWATIVLAAVVLVSATPIRLPSQRQQVLALLLALPAAWLLAVPYRVVPMLFAAGLFLQLVPMPRRWPRTFGQGAIVAGTILLVQALVLLVYEILTARCHELPRPLAAVVGAFLNLLGLDVAVDGSTIALRSVSDLQRFGGTWELVLDPATVCFVAGGFVLLALANHGRPSHGERQGSWLRSSVLLLIVTVVWIPIRLALLLSVVLHQTLRSDAITYPNVAEILVNSWLHVSFVAVLALLVSRMIPKVLGRQIGADAHHPTAVIRTHGRGHRIAGPILVVAGTAVFVALFFWEPAGVRKSGRVMIVERHSTWEPTTEPYGTTVYGEAGSYNYGAIYNYCQQYYEMSRLLETEPINDKTLGQCDVLVIKTPTARYSREEVAAVVRFVDRGGSLLMIGDHTNVFNMNTYLNDVARHFGFTFRNDLLFRIGNPYKQAYQPPQVAHPIVQHVPPMHFAVSCSIDPGCSPGRMVIRSTGLWSLPAAYHVSNYHPQAEYRPQMHYGAWCQLWSTGHGSGRVVGFADSTLFSNFCTFQPGKMELLLGMLEWLNHSSPFDRRGMKLLLVVPCVLIGFLMVVLGWWFGRRCEVAWPVFIGAAFAGWSAAALAVTAFHRPVLPVLSEKRPMPHVVIDRTLSEVPLFTGAFSDDEEGAGYGLFEQWIPRVGNFISRRTGADAFLGDGLVVICPTRSVDHVYRERLVEFVRSGGRVLVVDSIEVEGSTANSLLRPFGLASNHNTQQHPDGMFRWSSETPETPLSSACEITGGETLASWEGLPVAARARYGAGTVTAIGFGSLFNDENMGSDWLPEPEPEMLELYEVLFAVLRISLPTSAGNSSTDIPPR